MATASLTMLGFCVTCYTSYLTANRAKDASLLTSSVALIGSIRGRLDTLLREADIEPGKRMFYPEGKSRMENHFKKFLREQQASSDLEKQVRDDIDRLFELEKNLSEQHKTAVDNGGKVV
ncbi:hypothetical protein JIN84_08825 [Luteolibacter yonseiensis]|uniref:Uncharacterized protein n=1 Tax=Luteolibacter yonseiensis TaxID=1144680 RepID=A0A934QZQ7_9BACT|nr:hypothetical protein [Luteolibacter yonseiensis]MBK1815718.1 hypothetical protein [Luteolibacter yonseiensis]